MRKIFNPRLLAGALAIIAVFSFSSWGVAPKSAPHGTAYESLKVYTDVLSIVQDNYAEDVESKEVIYNSLKGMVKALDPHSSFMTPEEYKEMQVDTKGSFGGIGIEIGMKENQLMVVAPIEDTPAFKAGLLAGDRIVKIGDKSTREMALSEAVNLMRGPKDTPITISIMREGFDEPRPFTLTRAVIKVKSVKFKMLDEGFGYVKINQFQERTSEELDKALNELSAKSDGGRLKGLVLDLRNNPGGALQDHKRAMILGVTTFGKGSVQTIIPLSDGSAVRLTTSKYYTPSGRSIQARGIEPDIVVGEVPKGHLKEADLEGHLAAEGPEVKQVKQEERIEKIKGAPADAPKLDKETAEDVQLQRAVEYLKSWFIFKGTTQKVS